MKMSPGSRSTISVSTCTDSWMPTARVITLRYCEAAACSLVMVPALSCAATRVWSSVRRWHWPSRTRYTRLSPTWPMTPRLPADHQAHEGGAHAALGRVGGGHAVDVGAGALHRHLDQRRGRRAVGLRGRPWPGPSGCCLLAAMCCLHHLDRARAGHLARGVPAHAVGDDVEAERRVDQHRVFVVLSLAADVGEAERFGREGSAGHEFGKLRRSDPRGATTKAPAPLTAVNRP